MIAVVVRQVNSGELEATPACQTIGYIAVFGPSVVSDQDSGSNLKKS